MKFQSQREEALSSHEAGRPLNSYTFFIDPIVLLFSMLLSSEHALFCMACLILCDQNPIYQVMCRASLYALWTNSSLSPSLSLFTREQFLWPSALVLVEGHQLAHRFSLWGSMLASLLSCVSVLIISQGGFFLHFCISFCSFELPSQVPFTARTLFHLAKQHITVDKRKWAH